MIEIVIPVLNEEKILHEKRDYYDWLQSHARIIFVDGGSADKTKELAGEYGEVIVSERGRAKQMNTGAQHCRGNHILFLHADTFISEGSLEKIEEVMTNGAVGGSFSMAIDDKGFIFRIFERIVNWQARVLKILDGDLGLFVRKDIFNKLNQFPEVSIMEDILFSKKLRQAGKVAALNFLIVVSSRRWREQGFLKTFYFYCCVYFRLLNGEFKENNR